MTEKTEQATPYKLEQSRKKGQVSKSIELTNSLSLLVMLGMITALWPQTLFDVRNLLRQMLHSAAGFSVSVDNISHLQHLILNKLTSLWLPFALAGVLTTILATMAQTGIIWSTTPLIPDFKRLSLNQGLKKLFSLKTCFEALKSLLKLVFAFILLYCVLKHHLPAIIQLIMTPAIQAPAIMMHHLLTVLFQLLLLLSALAILDKFYTRWKYSKDTRMTKQEVKDEHKQKEGDPKVKSKIKQLQAQLRQKTASLKQVQTADVIITNPTHLAIALKYDPALMSAPKVVCKAQDEMVVQVKQIAKRYGVPLIENKVFARALHQSIELNQVISRELFPMAAGIFRRLEKHRRDV